MSKSRVCTGVIFVGPGRHSQGGISAVIENYGKTSFWREFDCSHFASTADYRSKLVKFVYGTWRICLFAYSILFSRRPWAISIHTSHKGSFYRKLVYLIISRLCQVPAVLHIHPDAFAVFYEQGNRWRRSAIRLAGRLSNQIIFLSYETLSDFTGVFPSTKLGVLCNPVDIDSYALERKSEGPQRPRVLFLGAIAREKGVYDLVDAIPAVVQEFPDVLFTFAGNKEVRKLSDLISSRGMRGSAEVIGWIEGQAKIDILRSSTILVLPSYTEGVPNVILEAMASKLPIVTTPVGGIPSVLTHDQTAIFVDAGDVQCIADGLITLLGDEKKCMSLARAAFVRASELYSTEVIGEGLTQIYAQYRPGYV